MMMMMNQLILMTSKVRMTTKASLLARYYHGSTTNSRTIRWLSLQPQPPLQQALVLAVTPIQMTLSNVLSRRMVSSSSSTIATTTTTTVTRRLPTPPMPRTTYDIVVTDVDADMMTKLRLWWKNGAVLITIGWVVLLTYLLDRYLQRQVLLSDPDFYSLNKEVMIDEIVVSAQQQRRLLYQQYSTAPALYQCRVIQYYKMGGSHGLYNVQLHDIVEILQENVGPKQAYHLCRLIRPSNDNNDNKNNDQTNQSPPKIYKNENSDIIELGWYPITHLEKYTPPPSKRSWWKRLLFL